MLSTLKRTVIGLAILLAPLLGQTTGLHGMVTDDAGARVSGATIRLSSASTSPVNPGRSAETNREGVYEFSDLLPGEYQIHASAPGLGARPQKISVKAGLPQVFDIRLKVAAISENVTVRDHAGTTVSTGPANNSGAVTLTGDDLDALSDDMTALGDDLMALAGPSAGPNGGSIYVDGFSGGELPPKDSIREIRINQNPFSPEYDKLGFGRIEIFTKPGSDRYRGSAFYNFGDSFWNSRNPYASEKAPFLLQEFGGNMGGPISKKASFFADIRRDWTDNSSILNGVSLDPATLVTNPFNGFFVVPQRALRGSGRVDIQLTADNTLTTRYAVSGMDIPDAGIGGFNLVERGYDVRTTNQTAQLSDTQVLGAAAVNEVRFQFFHSSVGDRVNTIGPAVQVLGSFTGGGANTGRSADAQSSFEGQEYVSIVHGAHTMRFGGRFRGLLDDSITPQNFNGTYSFNGSQGPQLDASNQPVTGPAVAISSIEQYRRTLLFASHGDTPAQIRLLGGGPSQFSLAAGQPEVNAGQFDYGIFFGDDWRVKPSLTLSLGARYEAQTNMNDARDFAPRVGFAWAPDGGIGRASKTVIRGGIGLFFDRFALSNTVAEERYAGNLEQQYVVTNPNFFPVVPSVASLAGGLQSTQVIQRISSSLRAPYIVQSAIGVERQLLSSTTLSVTYTDSHGLHLLRSRDINAPIPGGKNLLPYGSNGPIFLTESAGLYNQNQLIVNVNSRFNRKLSLNGSYVLNRALSNSDGLGSFPANQYTLAGEYGPAATDIRHRAILMGSFDTVWSVRFSPLVILQSGTPFNITSGQDFYGTTLYNSRPGIATNPNKSGLIETAYGLLDPNPSAGETILGRNSGVGPGLVRVNLRVSKTFGLGAPREGSPTQAPAPAPPAGGSTRGANPSVFGSGAPGLLNATPISRRYNLIVSMQVENLLNHNNPGPIIGNITSPLFGQANQPAGSRDLGGGGFSEAANNRRLELQLRLNF